jgi:hypothetical protein
MLLCHCCQQVFAATRLNIHPCAYDAYGMTVVEAASQGAPSLVAVGGAVGATDLLRCTLPRASQSLTSACRRTLQLCLSPLPCQLVDCWHARSKCFVVPCSGVAGECCEVDMRQSAEQLADEVSSCCAVHHRINCLKCLTASWRATGC